MSSVRCMCAHRSSHWVGLEPVAAGRLLVLQEQYRRADHTIAPVAAPQTAGPYRRFDTVIRRAVMPARS
jgi:hypothetical protein